MINTTSPPVRPQIYTLLVFCVCWFFKRLLFGFHVTVGIYFSHLAEYGFGWSSVSLLPSSADG